jgi:hypothetical protein
MCIRWQRNICTFSTDELENVAKYVWYNVAFYVRTRITNKNQMLKIYSLQMFAVFNTRALQEFTLFMQSIARICNLLRSPGIDYLSLAGQYDNPIWRSGPSGYIGWFLGSINVYKYGLCLIKNHRGRKRPISSSSSPKHLLQNEISGISPSSIHRVYRVEIAYIKSRWYFRPSFVICTVQYSTLPYCPSPLLSSSTLPPSLYE